MKLAGVQVLRFIAAALVVCAHSADLAIEANGVRAPMIPDALTNFGAVGVDIFFVISGFIITSGLLQREQPPSAIEFLSRRWLRVAPLYFLMSAPWIAMRLHAGDVDIATVAATFLFWPATQEPMATPYLKIGWTLCFEMLFYVAVAAALVFRRWRMFWMLPIFAFAAAFLARPLIGGAALQFWGNPIILEFLLGAFVALVWSRGTRASPRLGAVALAACGLLFLLGFLFAPPGMSEAMGVRTAEQSLLRALVWGAPSALLLLGVLQLEPQVRKSRLLVPGVFLGDASYALYLIHPLVLYGCLQVFAHRGVPAAAVFASGLLLSVAAGAAAYLLVESPLQRALGRIAVAARRSRLRRTPGLLALPASPLPGP